MAKNKTQIPSLTPSLPTNGKPPPVPEHTIAVPLKMIHVDWDNNLSRMRPPGMEMAAYLEVVKSDPKFVSLKKSIEEQGLFTPLLVRPIDPATGKYPLISGYNRHLACSLLNVNGSVPVFVKSVDAKEADMLNIAENMERKDISTFNRACSFYELYRRHGMTSSQVAKKLSKTDGYVRALVMCRENLSEPILKAWSLRDVEAPNSDNWAFPIERKATTIPNLQALASMRAHVTGCNGKEGREACACPPNANAQMAEFSVFMHIAKGKSEEEARKLVEAEGHYKFPEPKTREPKGPKAATSVKFDEIKLVKEALDKIEDAGEAEDYIAGALALARFFLGETKKVSIGKIVLYAPPQTLGKDN